MPEMERFLGIAQGRIKVNSGGCYMKIIAEHTGCHCAVEFFCTSFSVSVHCHQWRRESRLWEDRKCPPDRSAFDFLGEGNDDFLYCGLKVPFQSNCIFLK